MAPVVDLCAICTKRVRDCQRGIYCELCPHWVHLSCTSLNIMDYNQLSNSNEPWYCHICIGNIFPFNSFTDDTDFLSCIFNMSHSENPNSYFVNNSDQFKLLTSAVTDDKDTDPDRNLLNNYKNKTCDYYLASEFNTYITQNTISCDCEAISVLHVNVRSLNKNFNKLLLFLDSIQFRFSVITVTETWTTSTTEHLYKIPGYICCIKSRADGRGGAVALYVQDSLCYRPLGDLNVSECADFEFVCVHLNVNCSLYNINVVYRPPGGSSVIF